MRFEYNEEEIMLQKSIGSFFDKYSPVTKAREFTENKSMNKQMQQQLGNQGVLGILSPEKDSPEGIIYAAIVAIEAGKRLFPFPLLENVMACYAAKIIGCDPSFIEDNEAGGKLFTIAWDSHGQDIETKIEDGNIVINGRFSTVPFAKESDNVLVSIPVPSAGKDGGGGEALVFISTDNESVAVKEMYSLDETYPVYELQLSNYVLNKEKVTNGCFTLSLTDVKRLANLLISAEMVGGAEETLKQTVEYTKVRKQFGVEIGKFQAMRHMAADMYLYVESAKTAVQYAAWAIENKQPDANMAVLIAKSYASEAYVKVAELGIQMHGGIGFTWEHDMHMFLKRAHRSSSMLGDVYEHREEIASQILDEPIRGSNSDR